MASLLSLSSSSFLHSSRKGRFLQPFEISFHSFQGRSTKTRRQNSVNAFSSSLRHETEAVAVQRFWQWLCDKGVVSDSSSPVKPATVPEGLGLVAQRNLSRNEVVVQVPKKVCIGTDTVASSEIGRVCGQLKPWISIALFLLFEKARDDSPWRFYLDILPSAIDSTIFWSEEELLELQGTQLLRTTLSVKNYVESEFHKVEEEVLLPNPKLFHFTLTLEDFMWAFAIIRSRTFSGLRGENLLLVPLADLVNHSPNIITEDTCWQIKGSGLFSRELLFSLHTPVPVRPGEQVLIQYDLQKSNADFALDYGFIEPRLDRNAFTLTLEIAESDPFFGDKLDIAESNGLGVIESFDIVLHNDLPPTMQQYLRLVALGGTDAFLLESIFRNSVWGHLELPVSRANEELICQVVRGACKSALSSYNTTIEEDERLLEGGNLSARLSMAVSIRAGEKKVLQQMDRIFEEREIELDEVEYYQERRLKQLGLVGEQGEIIFWETN